MAGRGRKIALGLAIGCLGVPMVLALIVGGMLMSAKIVADREGPGAPERSFLAVPLDAAPEGSRAGAAEAAPDTDEEGAGGTVTPGVDLPEFAVRDYTFERPLHLTLDLAEGEFIIEPGPAGSALRAEGYFDPRDYELTQEVNDEGDLGREVTIRFRRKRSLFILFFRGPEVQNEVRISIPREVPTALRLQLSKGESRTELGGLTLTDLHGNLGMGEHTVSFRTPLTDDLERVVLHGGMGEISLLDLGNARARNYDFRASMGEFRLDFGGDWAPRFASSAKVHFRMGECRVTVPHDVRIAEGATARVFMGEASTPAFSRGQPEDPDAPTLAFDISASMGGIYVNR